MKAKLSQIPAILVGLAVAVAMGVLPYLQGKSWSEIRSLEWGVILPPIVVGVVAHFLTVAKSLVKDLLVQLVDLLPEDEDEDPAEHAENADAELGDASYSERDLSHQRTIERIQSISLGIAPMQLDFPLSPEVITDFVGEGDWAKKTDRLGGYL